MNIPHKLPFINDEFGTRPAFKQSQDEFGETEYNGSDPDTGDRVTLSVTAGEWDGTEIRGHIGGKRLDVHIGTDEFGQEEISGSGAEEYKQLTRSREDSSLDWM